MAEGGTATARMARPATRTAPRFPKNESRSRSPTKRFPSNAPRSPRGGSRQRAAGGDAPKSPSKREKLKLERTESAPATPEASQRPKANPNKNKRSNGTNMSASFSQLYVNPLDDDFFLGDPTSPNAAATADNKSGSKSKPTVNGENFNGSWRPFEDDTNNKTDTTTNSKANDAPKSPSRRRERVGAPKSPGRGSKERVGMTTPKSPGRRGKKESSYETPNSPLSESNKKPSSPKKGRKEAVTGGGDITQLKPPALSFDNDDQGFSMLQPPSLDFDEDDAETETKDTKNSPQEENNNSPEPEQKLRSIGDIASQMKKENNNEKDQDDDEEEETKKRHPRGERKGRSPPRGDRHQKRAGYRRSMSTGGIEREPSRVLRRGQEQEEDDEIPERGPRKPPRPPGPPATQRPPPKGHLRGRAESLLNHSLLGDSGNGMDMSMSFSGVNNDNNDTAAAEAPAPNHQRRRRSSVDNPQRTTSRRTSVGSSRRGQRSKSAGRSRERPVEGGGGRSHSPTSKPMRKTKSLPEGDLSPETTTTDNKSGRGKRSSDGDNRSGRGKRSSDGDNRSGRGKRSSDGDNNRSGRGKRSTDHNNGERRKTSPSSGEGKSSPSPEPVRRRASGSTRRARSRTRPEDQTEQIDKMKAHLKAKNEELGTVKRAVSHSPQRPRTTKFPSNAPRSVSPSARTNHRNRDGDASPEGSRRGRRTGHSSAAARAQSSSPGHEHRRSSPNSTHQRRASRTSPQQKRSSPNSSSHQRRTSPSRDDEEEPITPEPAHKDHVDLGLAPPSGAPTRQSLSLANVFDMENSITLDGDGNDSSASEATDGGDTVLQFDPASMNSVTSFKRASAAESMSNAGVFKMENLSEKKPREEEEDEDESEGSEDSGGSYLPNAMGMSKSKNHRRRQSTGKSSHSPGPRQSSNSPGPQRPQRRESRRKRSPQGGGGDRGGGDRRRPESRQRRESLTLDNVFDQNSASVPNLGHNQKANGGAMNDNQASFRSHYESDSAREERRRKLQDRLNQRTNNRRDREEEEEEEDSEEDASVYLPSNMTGKSLTPPGSPRRSAAANRNGRSPRSSVRQQPRRARSRSSSRQRRPRIDTRTGRRVEDDEEDEDEEDEDMENEGGSPAEENEDEDSDESSEDEDDQAPLQHRESKRKVAMKFIKKNLKSVKHKIQDDLQGSSISSFFESPSEDISVQASEEEDEEYDPYNKKAPKTESKGGVKKKFKGLFAKKKQHQLLGSSGESDSDVSLEMQQGY